jgi:hypothetical protein
MIKLKDLIIESTFDDAFLKWKTEGVNEIDIELYIDKFKILKNRNVLRGVESDISQWIKASFNEFKKFVDEKDKKYQQIVATKSTGRDVDRIFENDKVIIISPNTWEASCRYGAGTKWCISGHVKDHWDNYINHGIKFYFIIPKRDRDKKYAVSVHVNGAAKEVYDELDKIVDDDEFRNILRMYNIPGESFFKNEMDWNKWLKQYKYEVRSDGRIDVDGGVNLSNMGLTKLPFNFGKVNGNFDCCYNNLTTLEGCPQTVGSYFGCGYNNLTTLKGCPQTVGGNFHCNHNKLTTLEGCPQTVGGWFYCSNNKLTTLKGAPQTVDDGGFFCYSNNLTTLEGAPQTVGEDFHCSNNNLTSLKGCPQIVGGNFFCYDQKSGKKFTEEEVNAVCNVKGLIYT